MGVSEIGDDHAVFQRHRRDDDLAAEFLAADRGRGLSVISQVSDELSISPGPGGTTITMRRKVRRPVTTAPAAR